MFLQYSNKADLKNARLVSKHWSSCASQYLFAKIFISPHYLNLEVFIAIAGDANLNKCVRVLEIDGIHFSPHITISEYFDTLWCQTETTTFAKEHPLRHIDPEIKQYVTLLNEYERNTDRRDDIMFKARWKCCGFAFIRNGHSKWMEEARYEKECMERKEFFRVLIPGLRNLSRLRIVRLRGGWYPRGMLGRHGSPLARSWNPLHAHPGHRNSGLLRPSNTFKVFQQFHDLTFALLAAGVAGVRGLSIESILPPRYVALAADEKLKAGFATRLLYAYSRLEELHLRLPGWCDKPMVGSFNDLHGLHLMVESMTALKRFRLELPDDYVNRPVVYFPCWNVFSENGHWPQLTTLSVHNLAIGTKDLISLLVTKMPSLRYLAFGNVRLLDGRWEGIVEYLRISKRLSVFGLGLNTFLLHNDPMPYLVKGSPGSLAPDYITGSYRKNVQSVMEYVVDRQDNRSLKHPDLMPDVPASHSANYLTEVLRLCGLNDTNGTQDDLVKTISAEAARYQASQPVEKLQSEEILESEE